MSDHQPSALFSLKGKTALITGATRGIGFALARGLGEAGACKINGRNSDTVQKAVNELNSQSIAAVALVADVTQKDDITSQIDHYEATTGAIDILINNAGMQHRQSLERFDVEIFDQMIAVNLKAAFYTSKALSTYMIARQIGYRTFGGGIRGDAWPGQQARNRGDIDNPAMLTGNHIRRQGFGCVKGRF